jgi:hypothetical protein
VIWDFFGLLSRSIRWFKFRFILHVIFLEELQKIKSSGLLLQCGLMLISMTHLNAEGDERIKQDYLAQV